MPAPPLKLLKVISEKEQTIEQLLIEFRFTETLEAYRNEKTTRSTLPSVDNENLTEKKGAGWFCTFCDKTFTTKGSAKRHTASTHSTDAKQFECPRCSSKFARRDDLYTHLRRMHSAGQMAETMIEEYKAEVKVEHKGAGKGHLLSVISHNEHLDVVLPNGSTMCRPLTTNVRTTTAKKHAKTCRTSKCSHWRVTHDDHEDVLDNGALYHKNEEGEWECHGELGSLDDLEFLLSTAVAVEDLMPPDTPPSCCSDSEHCHDLNDDYNNDFSFDDFDFFLPPSDHVMSTM
jgi:uncharacterized C2H2 Zn-finger protein